MITLRDYQLEALSSVDDAFHSKGSRQLLVMPTGTGKTTVFSELARRYSHKNYHILLLVHRQELVDQISKRLHSFGIDHGIIASGYVARRNCPIQVASIQTFIKRDAPPADLIIIDECHHCRAESYLTLWGIYPKALFLGVTATPVRLSGEGFDDLFDNLIKVKDLAWFFNTTCPITGSKYLVRPVHHSCSFPDTSNVRIVRGDYDQSQLQQILDAKDHRGDVIQAYKKHAEGTKGIAFCVNVNASKNLASRFNEEGISAAHVDGDTPKEVRKQIMSDYRNGVYQILTNVDLFGEGVDVPDIQTVILDRKTKSLSLYKQQVGRSFRPSKGKDFGLILDCVGLWNVHRSLAFDDYDWDIKGKPKLTRHVEEVQLPPIQEGVDGLHLPIEDTPMLIDLLNQNEIPLFGMDEKGQIIHLSESSTATNIELIPVSDNLKRLVIFESYLSSAKKKNHKLLSSVFEYKRYLELQHAILTPVEINYCRTRMQELNIPVKDGFWYFMGQNQKVA